MIARTMEKFRPIWMRLRPGVRGRAVAALLGLGGLFSPAFAQDRPPPPPWPQPAFPYPAASAGHAPVTWPTAELFQAPATFPCELPGFSSDPEITPIYYEGVPYRGKPTRVFAWLGRPAGQTGKLPGMVLVHGGGGTAFKYWVRLWVDRGYAVIAMDTNGAMPSDPDSTAGATRQRVPVGSGPDGWGGFNTTAEPIPDQWTYHAVAAITRGHSLLRSLPGVDAEHIGLTGASWGGILVEITASVDSRYRFAAPVYGCGFLGDDGAWQEKTWQAMPADQVRAWIRLWDPSQYLANATIPLLFCNGTNDHHFRPIPWQKTVDLVTAPKTASFQVRMVHSHPPAGDPPEVRVYADALLRGRTPLPSITRFAREGDTLTLDYAAVGAVTAAKLVYTESGGRWPDRVWQMKAATFDEKKKRATAPVPAHATAYYMNLEDARGIVVSTDVIFPK